MADGREMRWSYAAAIAIAALTACSRPNPVWEGKSSPPTDAAAESSTRDADGGPLDATGRDASPDASTATEPIADTRTADILPRDLLPSTPDASPRDVPAEAGDAAFGVDAANDTAVLSCNSGCSCSRACGTGTAACECARGCVCQKLSCGAENCAATCQADSTCQVGADGFSDGSFSCAEGAVCNLVLSNASNVTLTCATGSRCTLECRGVSNCDLDCRGGTCLIKCVDVDNCRRHGCSGSFRSCGDGVWACGRACP